MLAVEFDRQRWEYDLEIGRDMAAGLREGQVVDSDQLAANASSDYLARSGITRADLAAAIERAIGGNTVGASPSTQTLVVNDNRYQVNLSDQAQINKSNLNLGGRQINLSVEAPKEEVLAALRLLLAAAFAGDWNDAAFGDLAQLIDGREDVTVEDIRALTAEVGAAEKIEGGRIRELLDKVAAGTVTGVLSAGLSAGLGHLLANLPT